MSRLNPTSMEDVMLAIPCATCSAGPDQWCLTKSTRWATWLHSARTWPVYEAWNLGYIEAERRWNQ